MSEGHSDAVARRLQQLEHRVSELETIVLRVSCAVVAALLIAGALVPFGYATQDGEPMTNSVVTMPWHLLADASGNEGSDTDEVTFGVLLIVGFLGLAAVIIAMLGTLVAAAGRGASDDTLRFARVLRVLAGIGTVVVLIVTLLHTRENLTGSSMGPGGLVLLCGVVGYSMLLVPRVAALWHSPSRGV